MGRITLLENSYRYAREALRKAIAAETDGDQWQFAILLIVQAVELALKEKLRREHELLVYVNPDSPRRTVSTEQALLRLSQIPSVRISRDDRRMIELAVGWRNLIVHHEFDFSNEVLKSAFARLLGFLSSFTVESFGTSFRDFLGDEEWERVLEIQEYLRELYRRAEERLETLAVDESDCWACIMCAGPFIIKSGKGICLLCHYEESVVVCSHCGEKFLLQHMREIQGQGGEENSSTAPLCESCYSELLDPNGQH